MYKPALSRSQVNKELSKLQKINYNRFRWWRMYQPKNKPLCNRQPLRDRILNGDFDYSCYRVQAYWCEYELNDLLESCKGDLQKYLEQAAVLLARRKRLYEDFEKDESTRLSSLITSLSHYCRLSKTQIEEEMIKWGGSLIEFYYHIEVKPKRVPNFNKY